MGGWKTVLRLRSPDFDKKIEKMESDIVILSYELQLVEGQAVSLNCLKGWTFDQIHDFSGNLHRLYTAAPNFNWGHFFVYYDQSGLFVTPDLPLKFIDPQQRVKVLSDALDGWSSYKNGSVDVVNKKDYQTLESIWELFKRIGSEQVINEKVRSLSFRNFKDWKDLSDVMKQSLQISPVFKDRIFQSLQPVYEHVKPVKVDNLEDFMNAIDTLDFLKQFYVLDEKLYGKYITYGQVFVDLNVQWEDRMIHLLGSDWKRFMTLVDLLRDFNPIRGERFFSLVVQHEFPEFVRMEKMEDLSHIEDVREKLNKISPSLGDEFVIAIARDFINNNPVTPVNIGKFLKIFKVFAYQVNDKIQPDIQELYRLIGYFMANDIYSFLKEHDVPSRPGILKELKDFISIEQDGPHSKFGKLAVNSVKGNVSYIVYKVLSHIPTAQDNVGNFVIQDNRDFQLPKAYRVKNIVRDGKDVAYLFMGDPREGARVAAEFDVGFEHGGASAKKFTVFHSKSTLVLDFPVGFTTGKGKPTDIAVERGRVKNWLMSTGRAHGLAIIYKNGTMKIVDKRQLRVKDLYMSDRQDQYLDRPLDLRNLNDYSTFISIAKSQKLSIMANMLLINNDETTLIEDGKDSRRLLLEFSDGKMGVLNMNVPASTAEAANLARTIRLENGVRITKAIYCDTGFYDYFSVRTVNNGDKKLGHADHDYSSNRIFMTQGDPFGDPSKNDHAMGREETNVTANAMSSSMATTPGGIDLRANRMSLDIESHGEAIKFNTNNTLDDQYRGLSGLTPVIIDIQPMATPLPMYLGIHRETISAKNIVTR